MIPTSYPITLYHGDSYDWQFKLWLDIAKTQPMDLTGVTPKAEIRKDTGTTPIYPFTCAIVPLNTITMALSAEECAAIPVSTYKWDLQLTFPTGAVNTILAGSVTITPDVTDSTGGAPLMVEAQATPIVRAVRREK